MEPTADTQPLVPIRAFLHHNLFNGMVTLPRLHFEKDELVPARWYGYCRGGLRFGSTLNDWVQLQRTSELGFPRFSVRKGHVEDIGSPTGTDDVVVVEQVASLFVGVYGHVLFRARDGTASCNGPHEASKLLRVQGVAEGKEVWEESDLFLGEVVEGSKVPSLVYLCVQLSRLGAGRGKSAISVQMKEKGAKVNAKQGDGSTREKNTISTPVRGRHVKAEKVRGMVTGALTL